MKFTVHINVPTSEERNDFLLQVRGRNVTEAVINACEVLAGPGYEYDRIHIIESEVLEVYKGHVTSLWDRPNGCPKGGA